MGLATTSEMLAPTSLDGLAEVCMGASTGTGNSLGWPHALQGRPKSCWFCDLCKSGSSLPSRPPRCHPAWPWCPQHDSDFDLLHDAHPSSPQKLTTFQPGFIRTCSGQDPFLHLLHPPSKRVSHGPMGRPGEDPTRALPSFRYTSRDGEVFFLSGALPECGDLTPHRAWMKSPHAKICGGNQRVLLTKHYFLNYEMG